MFVPVDRHGSFQLDRDLTDRFRGRPVRWGFGDLSWITYKRTYSRDGEEWWQTCRRVVEGMFTILRIHCLRNRIAWDESAARDEARDAYERLWSFKWTPPGRGLWSMGTRHVYERGGAALNSCGFVSTRDLDVSYSEPFAWMFGMSMLGVGVGFDTRGKGSITIQQPARSGDVCRIADSREGWVDATRRLLDAYSGRGTLPSAWDYSRIRPAGSPLQSFGGISSGPGPLRRMLESLDVLHTRYIGRPVDARLIVDTMNLIGRCVVAGGVRRSAQIALGDPDDSQFLDLKLDRDRLNDYRWVSNNSVLARPGMDYREAARRTVINGEPGYFWLGNARAYGRLADPPSHADDPAVGTNPCVEQTLWDRELCCLVETYPARHDSYQDFVRTLGVAHKYAKVVTLVPVHDPTTNEVMQRNRRIGCSMTGIVQAINRIGRKAFLEWCQRAYTEIRSLDRDLSRALDVPASIKLTSVKPSGTVSLLSGSTPGVHWEHAPCYIRRLRLTRGHPLVDMCRRAGYETEPDRHAAGTEVVSFPIAVPDLGRRKKDVPVREKLELAAEMQRWWSDNQVSCTAEFDPDREAHEIPTLLSEYEDRLKGIVFLPAARHGYDQPPYEEISRDRYERMVARLRPLQGDIGHEHELEAGSCEGGTCELEW